MPNLKPIEIILILLVVVLLFGAKRLPDAARGLGRSLRIFKAETKGLVGDDETPPATTTAEQVAPPAIPSATVTPPVVAPVSTHPLTTPEPAPPADPGAPAER